MALDDLNKDHSGISLQKYWKDLFPNKLRKLYVYKAVNNDFRGRRVFSREDDLSLISLELIAEVEGISGGESLAVSPLTIEEDKTIKEIELNNVKTSAFTAFVSDLKFDYSDQDLFFTIDEPFRSTDINQENFSVLSAASTAPNIFAKFVSNINAPSIDASDLNQKTISWTLIPAILNNNLQSSKIAFIDKAGFSIPYDKPNFEIESIDIESDHSFLPEYGNWIQGKGLIETKNGNVIEQDLSFKADKGLLPIGIIPFSKNGNVQFAVKNFNKYIHMPWVLAKQFLSTDRSIKKYILQNNTEQWATDLHKAIVDMFIMSWAFSTGFSTYRDVDGNIKAEKIGDIAIKSLENKDAKAAVDQVLKNWSYKNPTKLKEREYIRALQILAASSEWVKSSYCISGGLTEFHKTIFDFYLDLDSTVNKNTQDINMNLNSLRYTFEEITDAGGNKVQKIKSLIPSSEESSIEVDVTDRFTTIAELDDPISISSLYTFAGDIDSTKESSSKYMVGADITKPDMIEKFLINEDISKEEVITKDIALDTTWNAILTTTKIDGITLSTILNSYTNNPIVSGLDVSSGYEISQYPDVTERLKKVIKFSKSLPKGAYDIVIKSEGNRIQAEVSLFSGIDRTAIERWEGVVIEYKLKVTTHGIDNKKFIYNKLSWETNINQFVDGDVFKRKLMLSDEYKDADGNYFLKIQKINRLWFSFFLGNYIDIKINYKYTNDTGTPVSGTSIVPRLTLPSLHDERRTKIGIRF